jgi:hypothetical protein
VSPQCRRQAREVNERRDNPGLPGNLAALALVTANPGRL